MLVTEFSFHLNDLKTTDTPSLETEWNHYLFKELVS